MDTAVSSAERTIHFIITMAHHDSRSPRLDRELGSTDIANNIIITGDRQIHFYGAESYSIHNKTRKNAFKCKYSQQLLYRAWTEY